MQTPIRDIKHNEAFVIYRLPNHQDHVLLTGGHLKRGPLMDLTEHTFVISSFEGSAGDAEFIHGGRAETNGRFRFHPADQCDQVSTLKTDYLGQAERLISEVRGHALEKVVLSRIKVEKYADMDLYDLFMRLKSSYPTAFVYLYHVPGRGCWCGASPEILVQMSADAIHTMALAGTQRDNGLPMDLIDWTSKEIHEQHVIEQFIEENLNSLKLTFQKEGPYTVKAGEVLHLCSDFLIRGSEQLAAVIQKMHPGPAICGTPGDVAFKRILEIESHNREDYCGLLGPIQINGETALFINLRCMKIYRDACVLYLGGGLTARSNPELEWTETEMKGETLLSVLEKAYS